MTQRMTLITSPAFVPEAQLKKAGSFAAIFGNDNPLCLDIGCGIGDFVVQVAQRHPERNFVAIDIFNQGCRQTCARIDSLGLSNVRMMRIEARYLLHDYIGKDELDTIYVNCPDPWPKKRHLKRRMFNRDFLDLALYCVKPGGIINFATDFVDYGERSGELLSNEPRVENLHASPYTHELGDYPISKYMRRFLDLGQPIYLCRYRKKSGVQTDKPMLSKGFRLRWVKENPAE